MNTAAILLSLAAAGGLAVASFPLRGIPRPPTWLALGHGAVAAAGLLTLIYFAATSTLATLALIALGVLVLAAVGGAALFTMFHMQEKPLPIPLVLGHGLTAITGVILLWVSIVQGP